MPQTAANVIAQYYDADETMGPAGAFGREGGETGFRGNGNLSLTEEQEWQTLHDVETVIREAHSVDTCDCCGPLLTREGRELLNRARKALLPTWYQRRTAGLSYWWRRPYLD